MTNFVNSKCGKISCAIVGAGSLSLLIYFLNNKWSKPKPKPKPESKPKPGLSGLRSKSRSFFIRELHSGFRAWSRLKTETYEKAQINQSVSDSIDSLRKELQKECPDLMILQQNVENLENHEKEDEAMKILEEALKKASDKPHEAYEIEMLLVELGIYKGGETDLQNALKYKCLEDSLRDARRPLFKAIIYKMLGHDIKKVRGHWDEFILVRDPYPEFDFEDFERHVDRLQQANAQQNKDK